MQKVKSKILFGILLCFLFNVPTTKAQQVISYSEVDSLSYKHYLLGEWEELILLGKKAIENGINFKWLQQRLGYAYFAQKKYFKSLHHYEQALNFDTSDEITRLYLYYIGKNIGDAGISRFHAGKLPSDTRETLKHKDFKPLDALELEYSHANPADASREDTRYRRLGLNSWLGNRIHLYQNYSDFEQVVDYSTLNNQKSYYGLLSFKLEANTSLQAGFHHISTTIMQESDTSRTPGNMLYLKMNRRINRFNLGISGASFNDKWIDSQQLGFHVGIGFSGTFPLYFGSSLYRILETGTDTQQQGYQYARTVFKQTAGILWWQKVWTEGSVILGNQNYFADNGGLYVYNSLDPTIFSNGLSVFAYPFKQITLYANFTISTKYIYIYETTYQQKSITGGLIWHI